MLLLFLNLLVLLWCFLTIFGTLLVWLVFFNSGKNCVCFFSEGNLALWVALSRCMYACVYVCNKFCATPYIVVLWCWTSSTIVLLAKFYPIDNLIAYHIAQAYLVVLVRSFCQGAVALGHLWWQNFCKPSYSGSKKIQPLVYMWSKPTPGFSNVGALFLDNYT